MFIYLSKKIAIPHNIPLSCLGWNAEQGWIASGGANGLLKILKLDNKSSRKRNTDPQETAVTSPAGMAGALTMNQTLEGHSGTVRCITWNESYRKLTTSDDFGLIIVWMLHKGMWFEEMINNRNKSTVKDMKWTCDGSKICIVYEDGAVIVGSVDGNRLWGKELETELTIVEWSPDGRHLLFGTINNEVQYYDAQGNLIGNITIYANNETSTSRIVSVVWYDGLNGYIVPQSQCPQLAIVFDNGRVQVGRDELDDTPILIDAGISINQAKWNLNGSILAIAGYKSDIKDSAQVQFYTPFGAHLHTLKVPGGANQIKALSWEGDGLRLALALDSFIYFANVRPDYQWGYFSRTVVYSFSKPERTEHCVTFWDTQTDEHVVKYIKNLISIRASGEHCVFSTRTDDDSNQYILILCNSIGSPVDSKYIDIEPLYITMTPFHVIVSNGDICYVWQYSSATSKLTGGEGVVSKHSVAMGQSKRRENREKSFHIDDPAAGISSTLPELNSSSQQALLGLPSSNDAVVAITASKSTFVIARSSGQILCFGLPHLSLNSMHLINCRAQHLALNCNSTRLTIIDIHGVCTMFDLEAQDNGSTNNVIPLDKLLDFERKDVWNVLWSNDNPELLALMEKSRMYVFRGLMPEEPIQSQAYLCEFSDLCIKAVNLDEIMVDPEQPGKEFLINFETKSLRDARELLISTPITEAATFIEQKSHPRLWRLLGECAVEQLNFAIADKAFVRCSDYQSLQFVKRLKLMSDKAKQKAEVAAYFRRFDEAESLYLANSHPDLAVELRTSLGDWFRVVQLMTASDNNVPAALGIVGDDEHLLFAYDRIGDYYADRQKWNKAFKFYQKAKNAGKMIDCAYLLDDFATLTELIESTPPSAPYIISFADKFASVGLCSEAVQIYLKAEQPKLAIDCCVMLNQWDEAVRLAETYKVDGISALLTAYATHLLSKEKWFQAVELYRRAGKHLDASRLLAQLAVGEGKKAGKEVRAKKLFVMAALEMEKHKEQTLNTTEGATTSASTIQSLLDAGISTSALGSGASPWHGAEAFHLLLLAQRHFYEQRFEMALATSRHLHLYDDCLDAKITNAIVALSAFAAGYFRVASKAFCQLEKLESLTVAERANFSSLALNIFLQHRPIDPPNDAVIQCINSSCRAPLDVFDAQCNECGKDHGICIVSGRSLAGVPLENISLCRLCRHRALTMEWRACSFCPLCHGPT